MRLVLLALLTCLPLIARADIGAVVCVQQQLQAAGLPVGDADGVIGQRTLTSWRSYAAARRLDISMRLDELTAPNHCHRIGLAEPALQRFWPATTEPFNFVYAPEIPDDARLRIRDAAHQLLPRVADLLGVQVAARSHVIVGTQARPLARLIRDTITYRIRDLDQGLTRDCSADNQIGAAASRGMLRLCIPALAESDEKVVLPDLEFVLAHEITHVIEMQIEGDTTRQTPGLSPRPGHPPLWFIEGLADLVGAHLSTGRDVASVRRQVMRRLNSEQPVELAALDSRAALVDHRQMIYRVGLVAVADLVEDHGFDAFGRIFVAMGNGAPFEPAFQQVFGESLGDFEARIDRMLQPAGQFGSATASAFPPPTPEQTQAIRCVQRALTRMGFSTGGADGVIGPRTQAAFAEYLRAYPRNGAALTPMSAHRWCDRFGA